MSNAKRILVVEDEPDLVRGLKDALGFEGFAVITALDGGSGLRAARATPPDCVILDLMLPDRNGFTVCSELRRLLPRVPILILSARSQESDIIRGLEAGADDYVRKPFGIGELVARINALLRRTRRPPVTSPEGPILIGEAAVDLRAQSVVTGQGQETLTFYEAECLKRLHGEAGKVVSRDELLRKVWGAGAGPGNRTVDNVIVKLRRKLGDDAKHPRHILTVYGTGYKLVL
jgi:DNA-binding response OmpR family regulator